MGRKNTYMYVHLGGISLDSQNYVLLLEELKAAVGNKYGLTIAIPASYCEYLQSEAIFSKV